MMGEKECTDIADKPAATLMMGEKKFL